MPGTLTDLRRVHPVSRRTWSGSPQSGLSLTSRLRETRRTSRRRLLAERTYGQHPITRAPRSCDDRNHTYLDAADSDSRSAFLFHFPPNAAAFTGTLKLAGARYRKTNIEGYQLFYDVESAPGDGPRLEDLRDADIVAPTDRVVLTSDAPLVRDGTDRSIGLRADRISRIGNEAIVNLETFTLEGKAGKHLRAPVNKLSKAGYKFILHQPPIDDALLEELHTISDEWLTMMHGSEKRFSLGWFDEDYIRNSRVGVVYTPEHWISDFANIVPEYQIKEVTIDLMRHRRDIENGTMEFLFVSLFQWAGAQGYGSFNLGLSSLSGVGEQATDPAIERIMHFIYEHVNQFYNFTGLHAFKEKFQPEWSPRYLIYLGVANLARAWLAVIQADSGSNNILSGYLKRK